MMVFCIYTHDTAANILWRVGCLPLIISISPSLNRHPSPGSRREWVCERRGAETARSGSVWWGTPEVNGASSPPLLYAECASPRETGLFPVHACWCPRGSRKGALREQVPHPWHGWRARMPGRIIPGGAVGRRRMKPLKEAAAPRAPDPRWGPPDSAPYLDPSFSNTALPSRTPQHDEDIRSPVYFGHFIPFGHYFIIIWKLHLTPHPLCLSFAPPATIY